MASGGAPGEDARAVAAADPEASTEQRRQRSRSSDFDSRTRARGAGRLASKRGTPFHDGEPLGAVLVTSCRGSRPDQALRHSPTCSGAWRIRARPRSLGAKPAHDAAAHLLFGQRLFSRQLLRHPELIDQLVLRGAAALIRERADLRADLGARLRALPRETWRPRSPSCRGSQRGELASPPTTSPARWT